MENHYKDGNWQYPEFAQPEDVFLEIVERIDSPALRRAVRPVERHSSAATIRSRFLEKVKHRVVTMHASDRYLAPGATLDDLPGGRQPSATPTSCGTARPARD